MYTISKSHSDICEDINICDVIDDFDALMEGLNVKNSFERHIDSIKDSVTKTMNQIDSKFGEIIKSLISRQNALKNEVKFVSDFIFVCSFIHSSVSIKSV